MMMNKVTFDLTRAVSRAKLTKIPCGQIQTGFQALPKRQNFPPNKYLNTFRLKIAVSPIVNTSTLLQKRMMMS